MINTKEQKIIDLRFGENPNIFLPSIEAVKKEINNINKYPDPKRIVLTALIAKQEGINKDNIYVSNGIDGGIDVIFKIFVKKTKEVILPVPSFPIYNYSAKSFGYKIKKVYLDDNFLLDINKIKKNISKETGLIVIVNPNNPTGNILLNNSQIEELLKSFEGYVIVDEAYFEFTNQTSLSLLKKYSNLILFRSFSKAYGLAGLRIGIVFADKKIINEINETEGKSNKFVVNSLALKAAESVLLNKEKASIYIKKTIKLKNVFENKISKIKSIKILPSQTSFCLFKINMETEKFIIKILDKGILLKPTNVYENFPKNIVILGIPNRKDFDYVYKSFKEVLNGQI